MLSVPRWRSIHTLLATVYHAEMVLMRLRTSAKRKAGAQASSTPVRRLRGLAFTIPTCSRAVISSGPEISVAALGGLVAWGIVQPLPRVWLSGAQDPPGDFADRKRTGQANGWAASEMITG